MKDHTFQITVGAPDDLSTQEVCRLLNRIFSTGLDAALVTDPDDSDDPDLELIEAMSFQDAQPVPERGAED
jgi:hypothetical protein